MQTTKAIFDAAERLCAQNGDFSKKQQRELTEGDYSARVGR